MVFWRITYLMTLIQLSRVGAHFVDSFVMSRFFGSTAIAAAGLVNPFFTVTSLLAGLISTGCQSLCSQSLGAGNKEKANTAFSTSMGLGFTVSLLLGAATFLFAVPICAFLGARGNSADILPDAVIYLRMLALGTPGLIVNYIFAQSYSLTVEGDRSI